MKKLFKKTKVIYDKQYDEFQVYYKNFLRWHFDSCYKVKNYSGYDNAQLHAVKRAKDMLQTIEVYRSE